MKSFQKNKLTNKKAWILWLFVGITFTASQDLKSPSEAALKDEIAKLKKEVAQAIGRAKKTDSLMASEQKRFETMTLNNQKDLKMRTKEAQELKVKTENLASKISKEKQKKYAFQNKIDNLNAQGKGLVEALIAECLSFAKLIEKSLPWEREERIGRVSSLRRDLESGTASYEEGYSRLIAMYNEEIKKGDAISLLNKSITRNNGEVINAHLLKIGNQWLVYMGEEERRYGILERTIKENEIIYQWREELSFSERKAVRDAFDVKMAKKPPHLVSLPLSLSIYKTVAEGNR